MKLLAIDGGGIRGIYASHVLERRARHAQQTGIFPRLLCDWLRPKSRHANLFLMQEKGQQTVGKFWKD